MTTHICKANTIKKQNKNNSSSWDGTYVFLNYETIKEEDILKVWETVIQFEG